MRQILSEQLARVIADILNSLGCDQVPIGFTILFPHGLPLQIPLGPPPRLPAGPNAPARHSADYRSVHWYGQDFAFSPTQAACVKVLWEAWEDGVPDLSQESIIAAAGSEGNRLRDLFRDHACWGDFIGSGSSRGTFRLVEP